MIWGIDIFLFQSLSVVQSQSFQVTQPLKQSSGLKAQGLLWFAQLRGHHCQDLGRKLSIVSLYSQSQLEVPSQNFQMMTPQELSRESREQGQLQFVRLKDLRFQDLGRSVTHFAIFQSLLAVQSLNLPTQTQHTLSREALRQQQPWFAQLRGHQFQASGRSFTAKTFSRTNWQCPAQVVQ